MRTTLTLAALGAALTLAGCSVGLGPADGSSASPAAPPPATVTVVSPAPSSSVPSSSGTASSDPGQPTTTAADQPSSQLSASSSDGGSVNQLPPGFPLPDGATVHVSARQDKQIGAQIIVGDPAGAYAFWKRELDTSGYTVTSAQAGGVNGTGLYEIRYRGHGCGGDSQIAILGSTANLQCNLG